MATAGAHLSARPLTIDFVTVAVNGRLGIKLTHEQTIWGLTNSPKNRRNNIMNIAELKESKFLKKEDCGIGILVTIKGVTQENVAKEGAPQELKWCLHLDESEKPMVLNSTNGQIIAAITGSDDTDNWPGHKIVLYHDPNITFGGKLVGGIRARAPRNQAAKPPASAVRQAPAPQPAPAELEPESDVPF